MSRTSPAEPAPDTHDGLGPFDALVREHAPLVRRALARLGVHPACIDDAAQDVFVVLHRRAARFDRGRRLENWLWGIARGVASTYRRSDRRRRRLVGALPRESTGPSLDRELARGQAARILDRFLRELDPDKCAVFVLADIEGRSGPEIADRLALNVNTVYARLRAARRSFADAVAEHRVPEARPLFAAWWPALLLRGSLAGAAAAALSLALTSPEVPDAVAPEVVAAHATIPDAPRTIEAAARVPARPARAVAPDDVAITTSPEPPRIQGASRRVRSRGAWTPTRTVAPLPAPAIETPRETPWGDRVLARAPVGHPSLVEVRPDFVDALVHLTAGL